MTACDSIVPEKDCVGQVTITIQYNFIVSVSLCRELYCLCVDRLVLDRTPWCRTVQWGVHAGGQDHTVLRLGKVQLLVLLEKDFWAHGEFPDNLSSFNIPSSLTMGFRYHYHESAHRDCRLHSKRNRWLMLRYCLMEKGFSLHVRNATCICILSDPTEPLSDRTAHSGCGLNLDIR